MTHATRPRLSDPAVLFACLAAACLALGLAGAARAQGTTQGASPRLNVLGVGEVEARPTRVTMVATVSGNAPLVGDAMVKFRDAKRRATQAIEALEIDGLTIEGQGPGLHSAYDQQTLNMLQQRMWNNNNAGGEIDTRPQIIVQEQLKVAITGIDQLDEAALLETLIRLIETAQDAGLNVGGMDAAMMIRHGMGNQPMSLFAFEVAEPDKAHARARAAAIADAKARAQEMARQAGVGLGPIVGVAEQPLHVNNQNPYQNSMQHFMMAPMRHFMMAGVVQMDAGQTEPMPSHQLGPTTIRVRVNLSFAIRGEE